MQDCTRCDQRKPLEAFARDKASKTGRRSCCNECRNAGRAAARRANPGPVRAQEAAQRAATRDQVRARQRAHVNRKRAGDRAGFRARRRAEYRASPARLEAMRAWRAANRGRLNELARVYRANRRARMLAALVVPFTREQLLARVAVWGGRCYVCRAPWSAIDHVKPLAAGGAHCLANLRPTCTSCNSSKADRWHGPSWAHGLTRERLALAA